MRFSKDCGRRMQAAAQAMVDWYASTYGAARARRYLGSCEAHGLAVPAAPRREPVRWKVLAIAAALLLALASAGVMHTAASQVLLHQKEVARDVR